MAPLRVLAIDDDPSMLRMLTRGLGVHGYVVVGAEDGEAGVRLATTEPFAIVLLDVMLPGLDGHQTLAHIRSARPDLPVLMLTARDDAQTKAKALGAGANGYMTKPFEFAALLAQIRELTGDTAGPR